MDKTIKISAEMHQQVSIKAATLGVKKSALCEALLSVGLAADENILLKYIVTNHVNATDEPEE